MAKNFVPFVIHTTDGEQFAVPTRDHAWAPRGLGRVHVLNDNTTTDLIAGLHIASIHDTETMADATAAD